MRRKYLSDGMKIVDCKQVGKIITVLHFAWENYDNVIFKNNSFLPDFITNQKNKRIASINVY